MPLGTATINKQAGKAPSTPTFMDDITLAGDDAYPAGGSTAFQTYFRNVSGIKEGRTVVGVVDISANATHYAVYDAAGDRLRFFVRATGAEVAGGTDLSGTNFRLLVLSY